MAKDINDMMEEAAQEPVSVGDADLKKVSTLTKNMIDKGNEISDLKAKLKTAESDLKDIKEDRLPTLMQELGLSLIKLDTGETLEIVGDISPSITKANEPGAFKWLRENGHGDLIKNEIKAVFNREQDAQAAEAIEALDFFYDIQATKKSGVHYQTLKAFIKEQKGKGVELPEEFTVHEWKKAEIKSN